MLEIILSPCDEALQELLISELDGLGYDSYWQEADSLRAYIDESTYQEPPLQALLAEHPGVSYTVAPMAQVNWNAEWERNYEPIAVPGVCHIRATFHPAPAERYPVEMTIQPQMSFGTGHHATTRLVLQNLAQQPPPYGRVLDMGCGTGILGIYTQLRGATTCHYYDIDAQCVENTLQNLALNGLSSPTVVAGDTAALPPAEMYDTLIANINRNILLHQAQAYRSHLNKGGYLYLSGFYTTDQPVIEEHFCQLGFRLLRTLAEGDWQSHCYTL